MKKKKKPGEQLQLFDQRTAYVETPYEVKSPDQEWKKFIEVCHDVLKLNEKINGPDAAASQKPNTLKPFKQIKNIE